LDGRWRLGPSPEETEGDMEVLTRKRIKARLAALALTALCATLPVACGGSGGSVSVDVTPAAPTGTSVEATVGDTVVVSLDANATTGYQWAFTAGDTFTIESSQYQEGTHPEGVVGAGGIQIVTLRVTKPGSSKLTGTYARSWETPSPDAKPDFSMTVIGLE
jgi:inhibitor of cysteine peptidase